MIYIFEVIMLLCFAASWPFNIIKSYQTRSAIGKSIAFEIIVEMGYIAGMLNKVVNNDINYVLAFYILDFCLVMIDIALYVRNRRLDKLAGRARIS